MLKVNADLVIIARISKRIENGYVNCGQIIAQGETNGAVSGIILSPNIVNER